MCKFWEFYLNNFYICKVRKFYLNKNVFIFMQFYKICPWCNVCKFYSILFFLSLLKCYHQQLLTEHLEVCREEDDDTNLLDLGNLDEYYDSEDDDDEDDADDPKYPHSDEKSSG